jgi:hypothetical protein
VANEPLLRALIDAGLSDVGVAARLAVDPKTVQGGSATRGPAPSMGAAVPVPPPRDAADERGDGAADVGQ